MLWGPGHDDDSCLGTFLVKDAARKPRCNVSLFREQFNLLLPLSHILLLLFVALKCILKSLRKLAHLHVRGDEGLGFACWDEATKFSPRTFFPDEDADY
jgi:hypothetical protein